MLALKQQTPIAGQWMNNAEGDDPLLSNPKAKNIYILSNPTSSTELPQGQNSTHTNQAYKGFGP